MQKNHRIRYLFIALFSLLFLAVSPQTEVQEGDFCSSHDDCDPPKFVCTIDDEIPVCKRKAIFPLYGIIIYTYIIRKSIKY